MQAPGGQIELDGERSVYESDIEGDWLSAEDHSEDSITPGSTVSDSPRTTGTPLSTTPRSTLRAPSSFTATQREQEDALKAAPQQAAEVAPLQLLLVHECALLQVHSPTPIHSPELETPQEVPEGDPLAMSPPVENAPGVYALGAGPPLMRSRAEAAADWVLTGC